MGKKFSFTRALVTGLCCGFAIAGAEEAPTVRFLALGEAPPFRQVVRGGVREELEAPEGTIPPRELQLTQTADAQVPVRLALGRASAPVARPAGEMRLQGRAGEWAVVKPAEAGSLLVLLKRQQGAPNWEKPQSLVLPDDAAAAPAGSFRLVNFSPVNVAVVFGAEKLALKPGMVLKRDLPVGKETVFQVAHGDGQGSLKRFHAASLSQAAGERTLAVIYPADGEAARQPLRVAVQREGAAK